MGTFSDGMRTVATNLTAKLGNPCTMTKVTVGEYITSIGESPKELDYFATFSAPVKKITMDFGQMGTNTNLSGFDDNKVIIPWFGEEVDTTWLYNGHNITTVAPTDTQGDVVIYTLTIEEH